MQSAAASLTGRCSADWGGNPYPSSVSVLELRVDPADGSEYTLESFQQEYGGRAEWDLAGQVQHPYSSSVPVLELRVDPADGSEYTLESFQQEYGGRAEWDLAGQVQQALTTWDLAGQVQQALTMPDKLELRIDSADGHAYTLSEFLEEYGRTLEWELAVQLQSLQLSGSQLDTQLDSSQIDTRLSDSQPDSQITGSQPGPQLDGSQRDQPAPVNAADCRGADWWGRSYPPYEHRSSLLGGSQLVASPRSSTATSPIVAPEPVGEVHAAVEPVGELSAPAWLAKPVGEPTNLLKPIGKVGTATAKPIGELNAHLRVTPTHDHI
jgi:hypothetical protein